MQRIWTGASVLLTVFGAWPALAAEITTPKRSPAPAPAIDKQKLEGYLRYAEGFAPSVQFVIDDPVAAPFEGYYRLLVHLSMGQSKQDKAYYVTSDGEHVLSGTVWDLKFNPFLENVAQLPADGPSFGPSDAKITIVVFSDFQCPYCREFARTLRDNLPQKYPKNVRVIFKDFPIESLHPWARAASEAAHCIGDGQPETFWPFHDWIFQHQQEINGNNLRDKAISFGREHSLDVSKLASCLDTHATKAEVEASMREGRTLAIQQTPTFYLNGRPVAGAVPWTSLNTLIEMELNRPSFIPGAQATR